ncbi:protein kilB (plasmid) [Streptomyces platensis]|uniref:protein kilB n=1 Tax=Streptomyces platensis TaxID=58346 RepID=UPI002ED540E8|nr:protein kilB [Streptomyces platensis]
MWQSIIAILGTLAGASTSAWFQQRGQRAERAAAATATHRRDALDAVTDLVTALADHRKAMWLREDARLAGVDWAGLRADSHATRAAITAPAVRVTVLLPALAGAAQAAAAATYAMRNATDHAELDAAREGAVTATDALTHAAGRLLAA